MCEKEEAVSIFQFQFLLNLLLLFLFRWSKTSFFWFSLYRFLRFFFLRFFNLFVHRRKWVPGELACVHDRFFFVAMAFLRGILCFPSYDFLNFSFDYFLFGSWENSNSTTELRFKFTSGFECDRLLSLRATQLDSVELNLELLCD